MVTFKGLMSQAKELRHRAVAAKNRFDDEASQRKAKRIQMKAQAEIDETQRLNEKLERLKTQEEHLKTREAIKRKRKEIAALESRVTTSGRIISGIGKELKKLNKKKPRRKK